MEAGFYPGGSQVARASRGRRLVLGSETNCAPDNLHGRSILGPERDSQESCFAVNRAAFPPWERERKVDTVRNQNWFPPWASSFLDRRGNWVVPLMILINCSCNGDRLRLICVARVPPFFRRHLRATTFSSPVRNRSSDSFDSIGGNRTRVNFSQIDIVRATKIGNTLWE